MRSLLALLVLTPALVGAGPPDDLVRRCKAVFRPLRLPAAGKLERALEPRLPDGIVIESGPFDALVQALLAEHAGACDERHALLEALRPHPSPETGKLLRAAAVVLTKENADLARRVVGVEESYGEVYDRGYMEASEGARRARKLAAVLVPFYRTLQFRNAEALAGMGAVFSGMQEGEARAWLLETAAKDRAEEVRAVACGALGRMGGADARAVLEAVATGDGSATVRREALAALFAWKVVEIRGTLVSALADPAWEIRALAIAACERAGLLEAVGPLVQAIAKEDGRLRQDIDDALFTLVGTRMYADATLWKSWWATSAGTIAARAREREAAGAYETVLGPPERWDDSDAPAREAAKEEGATSAFYGITTLSRRILFVIDISRSMQDPAEATPAAVTGRKTAYPAPQGSTKLDIARWQLHRAVEGLPDDADFNIVVYSESYKVWQPAMTRAAGRARLRAHRFIDNLNGNGTTNICDPLDKAFELAGFAPAGAVERGAALAADTIYLLSDGDPNRGRVADLAALLDDVTRRNRRARLVIHAVGIGEAAGSSFLEQLAARNGGRYVGYR